jgi:hypothetical protein
MSCNCNTANPNCEPCAICTPSGVTNLPDCNPVDPCDKKLDIRCITYNGVSFPCLDVTTGDDLISVLLAILNYYFPPSYCCKLEGELFYVPVSSTTTTTSTTLPQSSTTTSTSTSTSTSTTTTILQTCNCHKITNNATQPVEYTYVDCTTRNIVPSFVGASTIKYQCAIINSIIFQPGINPLDTFAQSISLCVADFPCPPPFTSSTTTTTTAAPGPTNCDTQGGIFINNYSNATVLSSITPDWFIQTGGSFPINNGGSVNGIHGGGSGSDWGFNITNLSAFAVCMKIYIDGSPAPNDTVQIPSGTVNDPFYFTDLGTISTESCVIITFVNGPCPT